MLKDPNMLGGKQPVAPGRDARRGGQRDACGDGDPGGFRDARGEPGGRA